MRTYNIQSGVNSLETDWFKLYLISYKNNKCDMIENVVLHVKLAI